jgi:DNA-binding NarL/FixJ family response regulator
MARSNDACEPVLEPRGKSLAEVSATLAARPYARRGVTPSGDTVRVMLVDDHAIVRAGLKAFLHRIPDIDVVAEATSGEDAVALATRLRPDVVVMDLNMERGDGLTATQVLAEQAPEVRVLILTMHTERERLLPLLQAGARGYLAKDAADRELVDAIRAVAGGEVYVRPSVARLLATEVAPVVDPEDGPRARFARLSEREQSVLRMVAEGYSGPEIGERLGITAKTVDTYKQRIDEKLGVAHRTEYVRFALDAGLLER